MKRIVSVIVTYNRKELLKECIEALLKQDYKDLDILIVDNNSTDNTYSYIKHFIDNKKVFYKNTLENLGGAGGFNYGIREAIKMNYDYIWIMDDDTIVKKDTLTKLLEADSKLNGNYGYLSSIALWTDNTPCLMNKQKVYKNTLSEDKTLIKTYHSSFVSMFFKKEVILDVGLPIKEFFIWGDDVEYSNRLSKKYDCYVVNNSIVIHKTKLNTGSNIAIDNDRIDRYKYAYRNEVYIARHNGLKGRIRQFLKINYHILRVIFKSKKYNLKKIKIIINNSLLGIKFNPKVEFIKDKAKVLEVFGEPFSNGGQESFIMNIFRNIDKDKIHMDFYTPYYCDNDNYKKEIISSGSKIYSSNGDFGDNKGDKKFYIKSLNEFLSKHKYEIVHIHSGSIFSLFFGAKIAKKNKVKSVIIHSHCGGIDNLKYRIIKIYTNLFMKKYVDYYFACSKLAAVWKFPKSIIKNNNYTLINNGIDINKLYYDINIRNNTRKKLNIKDELVLIHIGRFSYQKNHEYLIRIFKEINNINKNSILLLVGVGETQDRIKDLVNELKLNDEVKFLGLRNDINELLNASDAFILPSLFEGLPVVGVEAQSTGLPVFTSTNVTKELPIDYLSFYYDLNESYNYWAKEILKEVKNYKRKNTTNDIIKNNYDIKTSSRKLEDLYLGM